MVEKTFKGVLLMRKHYLIILITCIIIAGLLTLCMGCAVSWPVKCRHTAAMCKTVVEEQGFETRTVRGKTLTGTWHRQTQALIEGEWKWLSTNGVEVYVSSQDFWFEPEIYLY